MGSGGSASSVIKRTGIRSEGQSLISSKNSKKRSKQGGTLALVVALILVACIVGIGFILWNFLIGGSNQVRNLTDSGVLNVAKIALIRPFVTVTTTKTAAGLNVEREFGDLLDGPVGNRRLTLQNYNRLVAKAVFEQLNATSTLNNTALARQNARQVTAAVNALGSELAATLNNFDNLRGNFENVAQQGSANKLRGSGGNVQIAAQNVHAVAFAARPINGRFNASNVFIPGAPFPPGVNSTAFFNQNTVIKNINGQQLRFLAGYTPITSAAPVNAQTTYCVPLRPGEQPHSVALQEFQNTQAPPAGLQGNGVAQVIANTFRGGAEVTNTLIGNTNSKMRSAAVVGSGPVIFPALQQDGTIIVDNRGVLPSQSRSGDRTVPPSFTTALMEPSGFEIFRISLNSPIRWQDGSTSPRTYFAPARKDQPFSSRPSQVIRNSLQFNFASLDPSGPSIPTPAPIPSVNRMGPAIGGDDHFIMRQTVQYRSVRADRNFIMSPPAGLAQGQSTSLQLKAAIQSIAICSDEDFDTPPCDGFAAALGAVADGQILGGNGQLQTNLMTIEQYVLAIRGAFNGTSGGCVVSPTFGVPGLGCVTQTNTFIGSGVKDLSTGTTIPFPNSNPTLNQLMVFGGLRNNPTVIADLQARADQIGGQTNINAILATPIPFNSIVYITKNPNGNGVVSSQTPPASLTYRGANGTPYAQQSPGTRPDRDPTLNVPDGNRLQVNGGRVNVSRNFVPFSFWECGNGQRSGQMATYGQYIPSTGRGGLLGVFRFVNCPEATGPNWCCP